MTELNIIIRTADQLRKAEVALSGSQTGGEIIQAAIENWSLRPDADYSLVNATTTKPIKSGESLDSQGVRDGDVLEVRLTGDAAAPRKPTMRWTDRSVPTPAPPAVDLVVVVCPNCKASLRLPAQRSGSVSCPFCTNSLDPSLGRAE